MRATRSLVPTLFACAALALPALGGLGCGGDEEAGPREAMEEMQDEAEDAVEELEDEVDDRT